MEKAGERTEFCIGCRRLLRSPLHAKTIHCTSCGATIAVSSRGSVQHAKNWVKNRINQYFAQQVCSPNASYSAGAPSSTPPQEPMFPTVHGNKRALLIGVTYVGKKYELKGTINDVKNMKYFLEKNFEFPEQSMVVLTEKDPSCLRPTKQNMLAAMQWLVHDCKKGDSLVLHFSGHGAQQADRDGDEKDGLDETLCPLDYEANGMITDNEINEILVRPLTDGVKLHAIIDSCHSGTVLDLPYLCKMSRIGSNWQWEEHGYGFTKGTNGGLAISLSGCADRQTSADTYALSGSVMTGAMTYAFIQALENEPGATYGSLLMAMRTAIREAKISGHLNSQISALLRKMFRCGLTQEPQLCSSERFDVYKRPFLI